MEIAVISGKGGTGKSSVSAALATLSSKVILADCDVDAANLHLIFHPVISEEKAYTGSRKAIIDYTKCTACGVCMEYCRFYAISLENKRITISELSCDGCALCTRICSEKAVTMVENHDSRLYSGAFRNGMMVYGRLAPGEETSGKLVNLVREQAKKLAATSQIETIILDGPPGIGCPMISTITGTDYILLVTEPSKSALKDLERAIEVITATKNGKSVVINKHDLNPEISARIEQFCLLNDLPIVAKLPFDKRVVDAMVNCKSMIEYAPDSDFSKEIFQCFNKIMNNRGDLI